MTRNTSSRGRRRTAVWLAILALAVVDLLWVQFSSYELTAEYAAAETIAEFLPQNIHFPGARFDFACIGERTLSVLSQDWLNKMEEVLGGHFATVYRGWDEIPEERKIIDQTNEPGLAEPSLDTVIGLECGCVIDWEIKNWGFFWFRARYSDWEGRLAAAERTAVFVCVLGRWIKIWQSALVMA